MKKLAVIIVALLAMSACQDTVQIQQQPQPQGLVIEKQGWFAVGGQNIQREGEFDPQAFSGWNEMNEAGQTYHCDHAMVHFQVPAQANDMPLVFVHGFGGSGLCWESNPDLELDGFTTLMQKRRYATYVMDLPGRGQAGEVAG